MALEKFACEPLLLRRVAQHFSGQGPPLEDSVVAKIKQRPGPLGTGSPEFQTAVGRLDPIHGSLVIFAHLFFKKLSGGKKGGAFATLWLKFLHIWSNTSVEHQMAIYLLICLFVHLLYVYVKLLSPLKFPLWKGWRLHTYRMAFYGFKSVQKKESRHTILYPDHFMGSDILHQHWKTIL